MYVAPQAFDQEHYTDQHDPTQWEVFRDRNVQTHLQPPSHHPALHPGI